MNCLRDLAKNHNISILTSIHQPNNEIVLMFDKNLCSGKGWELSVQWPSIYGEDALIF